MPTYQYACTSCAEQVEKVQRFSDDPLTVCPACGGTLRKVFSPVGIVFKGSGFYRTDSRKASVVTADDKGAKDAKDAKSKGSDGGSSEKNGSSASSSDNGSTSSGGSASSDTKKSADTKSSQPAKAGSST